MFAWPKYTVSNNNPLIPKLKKLKSPGPLSWLNWNLEMVVFAEGGKPEYPEKNTQSTNNRLNPRNMAPHHHRTWAVLVGGKHSHHCIIPVLPRISRGLTNDQINAISFQGFH